MKDYHFHSMTKEHASFICNWTYAAPYSLYSMDGSWECMSELLNGDYYYAMDMENKLIGFICTGNSARVHGGYETGIYQSDRLDIGLGLRPECTGRGVGTDFLTAGIRFIGEQRKVSDFQLVVAAFNERAIKVYERVGFRRGVVFASTIGDLELDFIAMSYSMKGRNDDDD